MNKITIRSPFLQKAKDAFQAHMKDTNYGTWISKPVEIDSFGIEK